MTAEELRRACEVAGARVWWRDDLATPAWRATFPNGWTWTEGDPLDVLTAYVAERLVAMVRERDLSSELFWEVSGDIRNFATATAEQRIRACLAVLGEADE